MASWASKMCKDCQSRTLVFASLKRHKAQEKHGGLDEKRKRSEDANESVPSQVHTGLITITHSDQAPLTPSLLPLVFEHSGKLVTLREKKGA